MKKNWRNNIITFFTIVLLLVTIGCTSNHDHADHADTYTCPMHPTVVQDRPGSCPVCGMDLVRKVRAGEEVKITEELSRLLKSPNETVVASAKTIRGEFKSLRTPSKAQGIVVYDTRRLHTISARIGGRLESIAIKYPFQKVSKGQKIAEIYSPEMVTALRELLFLIENDSKNEALINSAKERLRLLGATEGQIQEVISKRDVRNTFSVFSPYEGYVVSGSGKQGSSSSVGGAPTPATSSGMKDGMGGSSLKPLSTISPGLPTNATEILREGDYVAAGQTLIQLVNPAALRVELNIPTTSAATVNKGSQVSLDFGNGIREEGKVDFIQPYFSEGQEFLTIWVYTKETKDLVIGQFVNAELEGSSTEGLWVPRSSVIDTGVDKVVFVKNNNAFRPVRVTVGTATGEEVQITKGISSSDEIAANAQYLIDSESFIKTKK